MSRPHRPHKGRRSLREKPADTSRGEDQFSDKQPMAKNRSIISPSEAHSLPNRLDGRSAEYQTFRTERLARQSGAQDIPETDGGVALTPTLDSPADAVALRRLCETVTNYGYCTYHWSQVPASLQHSIERLNLLLNLTTTDQGVITASGDLSLLQDLTGTPKGRFVPYTSRAMNWHTDGYYNTHENAIRCFNLHCVQAASSGGELVMMDTELLLIALYDDDPALVDWLSHPNAMTLPENRDDTGHDRPDRSVPLLFAHRDGTPGTRFTTRSQHIRWRTPETREAAERATQLINQNTAHHTTVRLLANQGLITRNVLHRRTAFTDSDTQPARQMLRGRYHQIPSFDLQRFQSSSQHSTSTKGYSIATCE